MPDPDVPEWPGLRVTRELTRGHVDHYETSAADHFTIAVCVGGGCRIESRAQRGWATARYTTGTVGTTAPGVPNLLRWMTIGAADLDMIHLDVDARIFTRYLDEEVGRRDEGLHRYDVLAVDDPVVTATAAAVWRARAGRAGPLYAQSAAQFLVAHLERTLRDRRTPRIERRVRPLSDATLARVLEHLHAHLALRLDLDDLAAVAGMSRFHFLRAFTAATGVPPHRYLTRARMDLAEELLTGTDKSVAEIARRCGYDSASHFAATFRRTTGTTPTSYRRR